MIISLGIRKLKKQYSLFFQKLSFSSNNDKRIEEVGFKTENIINTNELTYIVNEKLIFTNGKCLIYQSKKSPLVTFKRFFPYYFSIASIGFLIYTNPFKAVFPAAIPILWVIQLIIIKMMFKRYQWNQSIVHKIYLNQTGSTTQILFADKIRRKLFGQHQTSTYYNTIFSDPIQREKQEVMPNSNPFPQDINQFQKPSFGWAWCKYFSNGQNYILIPKNIEYIRKDVLVQLFKGKSIKNG